MFEEKFDSLLGEYKIEIEGLERDIERFVKRRKDKITSIIGENGSEEDAEDADEILISIRQYMLQLQNYMEEEVEQVASLASTKSEVLDIFNYVIDKLMSVDRFFKDLNDIIGEYDLYAEIIREFDVDDITDPLIGLIEKINDDISEIERS